MAPTRQTRIRGITNSLWLKAERSIAAMEAVTIMSNITPAIRESIKSLQYSRCIQP